MSSYIIIGVGSHAEIIVSILEERAIFEVGHVSYNGVVTTSLKNYLGSFEDFVAVNGVDNYQFIVAIGNNSDRKKIVETIEARYPTIKWFNAISQRAHIASNVEIGVGNTVCSGVIIATRSVIGNHCILNTNSNIDHHNVIKSFVHVGPSCSLCGNVKIYDGVFLGVGCSVTPKVSIKPWAFHRANSLISQSSAPIPMYEPYITDKHTSVITALQSGWVSSQGVFLDKARDLFRTKLGEIPKASENYLGVTAVRKDIPNVLLVANGTCATHCLFLALKYKYPEVKKIYCPNSVYVAVWNAALYEYPIDCIEVGKTNESTWNLDLDWLIENAEEGSAIVIVHNVGNIFDVDRLSNARSDLVILEDACEGLFGAYSNPDYNMPRISAGTSSNTLCTAISFFANKTITSGEGGAVLVHDPDVYNYLKRVCNQGVTDRRYIHDILAYNYRMTNLQAALLYDQLNDLSTILRLKNDVFNRYALNLAGVKNVTTFVAEEGTTPGNWMVAYRFLGNSSFENTKAFFDNYGIDIRPFFYPIHSHKHLIGVKTQTDDFVPELLQREIIMFPSSPLLSSYEIDEICKRIKEYATQVLIK